MVDFKLELVLIPVSDVDRSKAFYVEKAGFNLDADYQPNEEFRVVQLTPPGSACSITMGKGITDAAPGSYWGTHLVVSDIEAARAELVGRGVEVSEITHFEGGNLCRVLIQSAATTAHSPTSATPMGTPGSCRREGAASPIAGPGTPLPSVTSLGAAVCATRGLGLQVSGSSPPPSSWPP